jgi:hypothetical protein
VRNDSSTSINSPSCYLQFIAKHKLIETSQRKDGRNFVVWRINSELIQADTRWANTDYDAVLSGQTDRC